MNDDKLRIENPTAEVRQAFHEKYGQYGTWDKPEGIGVELPCTQVPDACAFLMEIAAETDATITAYFLFEALHYDSITFSVRPDGGFEMLEYYSWIAEEYEKEQPDLSDEEIWEEFKGCVRLGANWGSSFVMAPVPEMVQRILLEGDA